MSTERQRTCPSCGNEFSRAMEFCPVCMLRKGLAEELNLASLLLPRIRSSRHWNRRCNDLSTMHQTDLEKHSGRLRELEADVKSISQGVLNVVPEAVRKRGTSEMCNEMNRPLLRSMPPTTFPIRGMRPRESGSGRFGRNVGYSFPKGTSRFILKCNCRSRE